MSNLKAFGKLERTLGELDQLPRRLAAAVVPLVTKELQREFARGADPYGRKWTRLSTGKPSHLTKSTRLRTGTRAALMPGNSKGVRILFGSRARVASLHQSGTKHMPARKILPERGMPASWRMAITREMARLTREAVK
jgi:hypothetical protein